MLVAAVAYFFTVEGIGYVLPFAAVVANGAALAAHRNLRRPRGVTLVPVLAVVGALVVGMLLIYAIGYDAMYAYSSMIEGAVGSSQAVGATLLRATPIILTGLSVMVAFRADSSTSAARGRQSWGCLRGVVAIYLDALPGALHWMTALVAAAIGGGLWGALAGFLKVARGANEVVVTIMLNYVARSASASTCSRSRARCRSADPACPRAPSSPTARGCRSSGVRIPSRR